MHLPLKAAHDDLPLLRTAIPGPRSLEMAARLRLVESPDTTFFSPDFPIFWGAARGANVEDVDGNRFIDLNGGFGVAAVGHSNPRVVETLRRQSERLIHGMGDVHPNELKLELADRLCALMPPAFKWKTIFGVTGSDSVEAALKTAALSSGKPGFISFAGGYHGVSLGVLPATRWPKFREGLEGLAPKCVTEFPFPAAREEGWPRAARCLEAIEQFLASDSDEATQTGAILIEPIQGRGGIVPSEPGFLDGLRELCDHHGRLLIFDEIYTGMGRTGTWLASEAEGVVPDLVTIGKALGGGMPISVCLGKREVIDVWGESKGEARHTSTFQGSPLACACAIEVLKIIEDEKLIARAKQTGDELLRLLRERIGSHPSIRDIRGRGMMIGVEIVNSRSGKPDGARCGSLVIETLREGIILLPSGVEGNILSLTPPLVLSAAQARRGVEVLARALERTAR